MANYIGIDFGTSNSVVATLRGGRPQVLENSERERITPSVISILPEGGLAFGREAKNAWIEGRTCRSIKRVLGREESLLLAGRDYRTEHLATMLFAKLKADAQQALGGDPVKQVVVTVPANSKGRQRYVTKLCAQLAQLNVLTLINEPTAAAMAYGLSQQQDRTVMVYDFGGGTLDVTILRMFGGVFEELSSSGVGKLGGDDVDAQLARYVADQYNSNFGHLDLTNQDKYHHLLLACEDAKIALSEQQSALVGSQKAGMLHAIPLDRAVLEQRIQGLLDRSFAAVDDALAQARMSAPSIDTVLLVGGSSKIPAVRRYLEERLGRRAESFDRVDPMTAVAEGAAIASGILQDAPGMEDYAYSIKLEHSLCTDPLNANMVRVLDPIIERGQDIPYRYTKTYFPVVDYTPDLLVGIYEGNDYDNPASEENVQLAEMSVPINPPRPASEVQLDVTFNYDRDGILTVTIVDRGTGGETAIDTAFKPGGTELSPREMVAIAKETEQAMNLTQAGKDAKWLLAQTREKVIPFVAPDDQAALNAICAEVDAALSQGATELLSRATDRLNDELLKYSYLL